MHNGCILCGGVGVGKSHTAIGYYLEHEAPKDVYVITTAKKRDKQDWQFLWGDVGMTGNPENTMGALVTVDSWENIKKYEEVQDAFFIFDEQRLVGSGRWVKAFYKIAAANRWIMLSATPGDNWLDYVPVFRANGFIKNLTQFKEDHVVARWTGRYYQVTGYRQVPKLVRWRNQLLVDMPYEKHTTRHHHEIAVDYDKDLVRELVNKRWHVYEKRPLTDASELFRVMRKVVYSDSSRLKAVESLLQTHPKLIVFYNFDYELEMLRTLSQPRETSGTLSAESTSSSSSSSLRHSTNSSAEEPTPTSDSLRTKTLSQPSVSTDQSQSTRSNRSMQTTRSSESQDPTHGRQEPNDPWKGTVWEKGWSQEQELKKAWAKGLPLDTSGLETAVDTGSSKESPTGGTQTSETVRETSRKYPSMSSSRQRSTESLSIPQSNPVDTELSTGTASSTSASGSKMETDSGMRTSTRTASSSSSTPTETSRTLRTKNQRVTSHLEKSSNASSASSATTNGSSSKSGFETAAPEANQKEAEEWQKNLSPDPSSQPKRLVEKSDTETTNARPGRSESSPKKNTTRRSSPTSKQSSVDPSTTTNASGSLPPFQVAEWNGHKHEEVPTTTSWVYLVQYVAGAEAWECIETDAICFFSMPYSYKTWWQAHGRIDRLNTSFLDLHYYILYGGSIIEKSVKKSLAMKKSFNESALARALGF